MSKTAPTYSETVEHTANALLELREDNRCRPPADRVDETTFVRGCVYLLHEHLANNATMYGPAQVNHMVNQIFRLVDIPSASS